MPIFVDHDESTQDGSPTQRTPEKWWGRQRDDAAEALPSRPDIFASSFSSPTFLNRGELIQRLKRRQSPSWSSTQSQIQTKEGISSTESSPQLTESQLLPAVELPERNENALESNNEIGLQIERPKSALHRGDFRPRQQHGETSSNESLSTSPVAPWHHDFSNAGLRPLPKEASRSLRPLITSVDQQSSRSRATSLSSFVFIPPTSPLVHASTNPDLDFTARSDERHQSGSPDRSNRRHTFSPQCFQNLASAGFSPTGRHIASLRRESTFPYQAHQPRRSLSNIANVYSTSIPQTPQLRSRRPSITSESPLQHAPMVGSYEESILRGRMSTTPSRPLNFVAQIGVLGKGLCKSNLKCPPHVTVPFPAVFYSYNGGAGRRIDDSPSPYVGLIDLENSLPPSDHAEKTRRRLRQLATDMEPSGGTSGKSEQRKKVRMTRRSSSPKAPPGGSYRIPQQGQLQIIIKNPNKTAVKLFLVPYDLSEMEPGQKTFIRQRSYSGGPIIDMPVTCRKNLGSDRPEAALSNSEDPTERPVLRYLIHLHICSPSKGRYYLYKSVRVVFANRVPDDKEHLRNEIQLPEPRFSPYKPTRELPATTPTATSNAAAALVNDKLMRRRSAGFPLLQSVYDSIDGLDGYQSVHTSNPPGTNSVNTKLPSLRPIPFNLTRLETVQSRPASRDKMDLDTVQPSLSFSALTMSKPKASPPAKPTLSPTIGLDDAASDQAYQKWTRVANGYSSQGHGSMAAPPAIGEGLLARRLRGLDVRRSPDLETPADPPINPLI